MQVEKKPIGLFDSGIGGITILKELIYELPNENFVYFGDNKNAPYGPRTKEEVTKFSKNICDFLISKNCKLIVVACNTATAAAISELRKSYKLPIIGIEPAVKPACLATKTRNIAVLATAGTFLGNLYQETSKKYKKYINIYYKIGKELIVFAENGIFSGEIVETKIKEFFQEFFENNVDILVLGCTHYAFFNETFFKIAANKITIIDSAKAVAKRTKDILMQNEILNISNNKSNIDFYSSGNIDFLKEIAKNYLGDI